jgi:hypothetical protein
MEDPEDFTTEDKDDSRTYERTAACRGLLRQSVLEPEKLHLLSLLNILSKLA